MHVFTTLLCVRCERSITIMKDSTFIDLIEIPTYCESAHVATLAVCWFCMKRDNFRGPCGNVDRETFDRKFKSKIDAVNEFIKPKSPMIVNALIPGIRLSLTAKELRDALGPNAIRPDCVEFKVVFAEAVTRNLKNPIKLMTVKDGAATHPNPHFIMEGHLPESVAN